jgi:hypothetical protein
MTDDRTNENEGADPSSDIEKQNRETGGTGESRAGAGEGDDADQGDTEAQDLVKAGRDDFDPNAGQE